MATKRYEVIMETEDHMSGGDVTVDAEDIEDAIVKAKEIWPNRIPVRIFEVTVKELTLPQE